MFTKNHIKLDKVNSTNSFALSLKGTDCFKEGLLVTSNYQSEGYGQRGKSWESSRDKNLLFSFVIEPNISLNNKFILNTSISLALYDFISSYFDKVCIKWPNDILIDKQKIAGFVIHNIVKSNNISHSVIGVGVNVNQNIFKLYSPQATSFSLLLNKSFDLYNLNNQLLEFITNRIVKAKSGIDHHNEYLSVLFLNKKIANLEISKVKIEGLIKNVDRDGNLHVQFRNGNIRKFTSQELKFLF